MKNKLEGVFPVVLTPFLEDGSLDEVALKYSINFLIDKKVHGLVILGSSSEGAYLSFDEKKQVIDITVSETKGRIPVVVGIISSSTDEALRLGTYAYTKGVDALMIGLVAFFHLNFKDIYNHFLTISRNIPLPLVYYHFSHQFRICLKPEELANLFEIENLVGIKNSNLNVREMKLQLRAIKKEISLFTGSSVLLYQTLEIGGAGVICPLVTLIPDTILSLYSSYKNKDYNTAKIMQDKILNFLPTLTGKKIPVPIAKIAISLLIKLGMSLKGDFHISLFKYALGCAGYPIKPYVKKPLPQIDKKQEEIIKKIFCKLDNR